MFRVKRGDVLLKMSGPALSDHTSLRTNREHRVATVAPGAMTHYFGARHQVLPRFFRPRSISGSCLKPTDSLA